MADTPRAVADWMATGIPDGPSVTPDWMPVAAIPIDGVSVKEIRSVATSTGALTEIWRSEWRLDPFAVDQVFQRTVDPGAVTGWHAHAVTTDRLFCAVGRVRLSLYDGRKSSPTYRGLWHRVFGAERPLLVVVPPGVWHGVVGLGTVPAVILNLVDRAYSYDSPDHWRLPPNTPQIPYDLTATSARR